MSLGEQQQQDRHRMHTYMWIGLAGRSRANEYASISERMNMHINCANENMTLAYKAAAATMREWTKPNTIIIS